VFNLESQRLLHRHGKDWYPMDPVVAEPSALDEHDEERRMLRSRRIFRCNECDDQIAVDVASED
jgi:predicted SprT family Zn-dependent metalloprotease